MELLKRIQELLRTKDVTAEIDKDGAQVDPYYEVPGAFPATCPNTLAARSKLYCPHRKRPLLSLPLWS